MNSLMQLSRALMEAKQEKESAVAQALIEAKTERLENAADAKQQELLKVGVFAEQRGLSWQGGCRLRSRSGGFHLKSFYSHRKFMLFKWNRITVLKKRRKLLRLRNNSDAMLPWQPRHVMHFLFVA